MAYREYATFPSKTGFQQPRVRAPRLDNELVFALIRQIKVLTIWEFITKSLGALPLVSVTAVASLVNALLPRRTLTQMKRGHFMWCFM